VTKASPAEPVIVFTGGGIASGKSTALKLLYDSDYWKEHSNEVSLSCVWTGVGYWRGLLAWATGVG